MAFGSYTILAYIIGIILLFIIGKTLLVPIKWIVKLVANAVLGGVILLIINYIGGYISFHIPLNIITALVVGLLGIPGVILLVILKTLLGF